jgi:hypothetical protein
VDLQTILVLLVALGASVYLGRAVWRTWSGSGCATGCGCGPKKENEPKLIDAEELLVRVRGGNDSGPRNLREDDDCGKSENFSA